jgi:hypothetical protein
VFARSRAARGPTAPSEVAQPSHRAMRADGALIVATPRFPNLMR